MTCVRGVPLIKFYVIARPRPKPRCGPGKGSVRRTSAKGDCARTVRRLAALGVLLAGAAGCDLKGRSSPELVWGVHGVKPGHLHKPRAAAFDAEDHLYLADLTDRIQVFDRDGHFIRSWRTPEFNVDGPSGLTIDRQGRLLVADTHFYRVLVYSAEGEPLFQIGDGVQGTTPGRFGYPTDVVIDRAGNFLVAEYGENDRIQVFSPDGKWLRQWGGHGYEPGEFLKPRALAIDKQDRLFVADSCNHRIQVFDTQGKLLNSWGSRGDAPGQMSYPFDLAIGPDDCLYVCEYGNHRVQKFNLSGQSLGTWGTAGRKPGQLFNPYALAIDSQCNVSVVDSNNHRVQRFRM
jgi:DNA-binding beta-propeller fold protein YncE